MTKEFHEHGRASSSAFAIQRSPAPGRFQEIRQHARRGVARDVARSQASPGAAERDAKPDARLIGFLSNGYLGRRRRRRLRARAHLPA